jgi:hypothetical protein
MKQKQKGKICFVIYIAGKRKLLFFIYEVFVKQKQRKRSAYHYSSTHPSAHLSTHTHTWALASMRMSSSGGCPLFTSKLSPVPMRRRSMQITYEGVKKKASNDIDK